MSEHRHFLLGLFFLIVCGGIGYYTLSHSDLTLFRYSQELSIYFPRAHSIQPGSAVQVAGVRWGKVTEVRFDPDATEERRVIVTVELEQPLALRENFEIRIQTATLLGGRVLTIDPGSIDRPLLGDDIVLSGDVSPDPIEAIGELARDNREALSEAIDGLRDLVGGVKAGEGLVGRLFRSEELAGDLSRGLHAAANTFESADVIAAGLAQGEGTFGKLLRNDALYVELEQIAKNLAAVSDDARVLVADTRAGKGLVGRILTDEGLGADVSEGVADLRAIIGRIHRGEGTLGRIVTGEDIGRNVDELLQRLVDGRGSLGRLFTEDELYEDVAAIGADVAVITAQLREGRGTIGRLVMDEELYDQLRLAIGLITRSLEEFREAAPVSTMTGVIFGAF